MPNSPSCTYRILAHGKESLVQWCPDCHTIQLIFKNLVLCFPPKAFENFKETISQCYQFHLERTQDRMRRDIFFSTPTNDMKFVFSTNEIGEILSLLQEANFELMTIEQPGEAKTD